MIMTTWAIGALKNNKPKTAQEIYLMLRLNSPFSSLLPLNS